MAELRSQAVVLRVRAIGEADKMVKFFTRDAGIVTASARGSRRTKSKFASLLEPLNVSYILLHRGKTLFTFIQGELLKSYTSLHGDLERFAYAQYFCELCERTLPEGMPAENTFKLLVTALEALEQDSNPQRVASCFEISLLDHLGIRPAIECCNLCGSTQGPYYFNPAAGELLCVHCPHPLASYTVSAATIATMKHLLKMGFFKLSVCIIPPDVRREIHRICSDSLHFGLGLSKLKTVDFLQNLGYI
ncbi:MAG: DNA repair protein RecO [Firmicutes bacterium]|jgi:DNA repair protein RecO (recombination protein O)|nr:DNA repair protein RecO [Bacillota bacterium]